MGSFPDGQQKFHLTCQGRRLHLWHFSPLDWCNPFRIRRDIVLDIFWCIQIATICLWLCGRQWFCPIWNLFITPTQNTFSSKIALCKRCFLCNQAVTEGQYKESCLIFWEIIILSKTSRKLYLYRLKWTICVWYLFFLSDHIPAILQIYQSTHKYAQCPHCLHIHVLVKHKSLNPLNAPHYAQALQPHLSSGQQKTFALSSTSSAQWLPTEETQIISLNTDFCDMNTEQNLSCLSEFVALDWCLHLYVVCFFYILIFITIWWACVFLFFRAWHLCLLMPFQLSIQLKPHEHHLEEEKKLFWRRVFTKTENYL